MGKKTTAKVQAFRAGYDDCARLLLEAEKNLKDYNKITTAIKAVGKNHVSGTPLPPKIEQLLGALDGVVMENRIANPLNKSEAMIKKVAASLADLTKWIDEKSKQDPTTWRKIKNALKG